MPLIAQWLWHAGDPAPRNVHMQFRRPFHLAARPASARLHLSADSRYLLYVNGVRLGYGPARAYQFNYEYDTYDLTPHLTAGDNLIAVDVSHYGEATFQHQVGRAGLIAQLDLDGQPYLWTDAGWKAKPSAAMRSNTPRIAVQLPWEEQYDARLEDAGWTTSAYDDAAWDPAFVIGPDGTAPWSVLSPRTIPFFTDEPQNPVRARSLGRRKLPELVFALHAGPYIAPGDVTANKHYADAMFATVLHLAQAGTLTLSHTYVPGGDMPTTLLDGVELVWEVRYPDDAVTLTLPAGDHALLIDWHRYCHDTDVSLAAVGLDGLAIKSLLPGDGLTWVAAPQPSAEARAAALAATSLEALRDCGAAWELIPAALTPVADVYLAITAGTPMQVEDVPTRLPLHVPPLPADEAQYYVIDFGRLLMGWLEIEVEAPAGTTFDLVAYEAIQDGRHHIVSYTNNTLRYVARAGRQTYTSTLRRGCRYLMVAVHGHSAEAILHQARLRLATYPWELQGAFRSSDSHLNHIWEMCAYTLRLCSEDTFTDCPTYEQSFWIGDACWSDILLHQVVHGDPRLTRRSLLLAGDSLQRVPIANKIVPGDWETDKLPNWAFLWALGCAELYQLTGDIAFAEAVYPALAKQALVIEHNRNAAGILELSEYWHLLDWAKIPDGPENVMTHESCLAVASLKATATIGRVAGHAAEAEHWAQLAEELAAAINRACWRPAQQAYADLWLDGAAAGTTSQPTNIAAVLSGVATPEREAAVLPHLLYAPADWIVSGTPWMHAWGCLLVAQRGQMTPVLDTIRDRWGAMLDKGASTAWETFVGYEAHGTWWTRSWCHGWSAFPGYVLSAYVLGIRPITPGYGQALIAPQLGDLHWAEGRVPTPHGVIEVRVARAGVGMQVDVTLPPGVVGEVRVPKGEAPPTVSGSAAKVQQDGEQYVITLPAGVKATISG